MSAQGAHFGGFQGWTEPRAGLASPRGQFGFGFSLGSDPQEGSLDQKTQTRSNNLNMLSKTRNTGEVQNMKLCNAIECYPRFQGKVRVKNEAWWGNTEKAGGVAIFQPSGWQQHRGVWNSGDGVYQWGRGPTPWGWVTGKPTCTELDQWEVGSGIVEWEMGSVCNVRQRTVICKGTLYLLIMECSSFVDVHTCTPLLAQNF